MLFAALFSGGCLNNLDEEEKSYSDMQISIQLNYPESSEYGPQQGTTVRMTESTRGTVYEAQTDENGLYLFDNLIAGYYRVRFQVPDGYTATRYDQSADTAVDSDAVIQSESRWFYSRSFYLESGVTDLTWDAGIYRPRHRVETEIIHRVERPTVTRTVRRVRTVQTGDPTRLPLTFALLFTSAGVITWMTYRRRKAYKALSQISKIAWSCPPICICVPPGWKPLPWPSAAAWSMPNGRSLLPPAWLRRLAPVSWAGSLRIR